MAELDQAKLNEFRGGRQQLMNIGAQKQQMQLQSTALQNALDEISETKPKTVFKAVGNILLEKDAKKAEKELKETKENIDVRIESLQKQEDSLVNKLNKLKAEIEEQTGELGIGVSEKKDKKPKKKK